MNEAPPNPAYTNKEIRYLRRSFLWLYIVCLILNAAACWLLISTFQPQSFNRRHSYYGVRRDHWPSITLKSLAWPAPQKIAIYKAVGGNSFVTLIYAVAWNDERTKHEMEVTRVGFPLNTAEIIDIRVSNHKLGLNTTPPLGSSPSRRLHPFGAIINPIFYAFIVWIPIGFLPVSMNTWYRRALLKSWSIRELCRYCGYEIQDLPICPECGNPTHKPEYAKDQLI